MFYPRQSRVLAVTLATAILTACSAASAVDTPIPATSPPATPEAPQATMEPTSSPPPPTGTPTLAASSESTAEGVREVNIYLIAPNDGGASGALVGCNDSIVPVAIVLDQPTTTPIEAALDQLLSIKEQYYGESSLYNALYQSELMVESAAVENMLATIHLSGILAQGGECDGPRLQAQLEYTILQFPGIEAAQILINGELLQDLVSGQG